MDSLSGHLAARYTPSDASGSQPAFDSGTEPAVIIEPRRVSGRNHAQQASVVGRMRNKDGAPLAETSAEAANAAGPSRPAPKPRAGKPADNSFRSSDAAQIFGSGAVPTLGPKAPPKAAAKAVPKGTSRPRPKPSATSRRSPEPVVDSSPLEELVTTAPADYKPRSPSPILTDEDEPPASKSGAGPSSQRSPRRARKSAIRIPERSGGPPSSLEEAAAQKRREEAHMNEGFRVAQQLTIDMDLWKSQESASASARNAALPEDAEELERCPWCGAELPEIPSPMLLFMLQQLLDHAHDHPGQKISATKTVNACHRHHDELVTIPAGVAKGWPMRLEEAELVQRAAQLVPELEARVRDPTSSEWFVRWKQREDARRGAGHGIEAFSDMQAGYYGELGWITLRNVLTSHFLRSPPSPELDLAQASARIAPLGTQHFIDAVLLPEMVCLLIQEDCTCSLAEAKALKDESSAYGLAVFPAASDEHQGWGAGDGAFGEASASSQKGPFKRTSRTSRAAELDLPAGSPPKRARGPEHDAAPSLSPATQRPKARPAAASTSAQASGSGTDVPSQQGPRRPRPRAKVAAVAEPEEAAPEMPSSSQRRPRPRASNTSLDARGASGSPTKKRMTVMDLEVGQEPSPSPSARLQPRTAEAPPLPSQASSVVFLGSQPQRELDTPPPPPSLPASQRSLDASDAEPDDAASVVRPCFLRGGRAPPGATSAAGDDTGVFSDSSELSDADASGEEDDADYYSVLP